MKVLITDAEYPDLSLERQILEAAGFEVAVAHCRTPGQVIEAGQDAVGLLVQYAPVTAEVLEALPKLRVISRYGVGVDTLDLEAARARGVWVANVPDYGAQEVATHALAMILALVRHLPFYDRQVRQGHWHYLATGTLRRPSTLALGVVGLGRIGRLVATWGQSLFGKVYGCDPYLPEGAWPAGVDQEELEELFTRSDVVSLHLPLMPETRGLVNRALLGHMRRGSYLVNTARGGLVVLEDLLWALDEGILDAAALDVLPQEPPPAGYPVLSHPRVLLSPHAAFYSQEAELELRRKAALNIVQWAREGRPAYALVEGRRG